MKRSEVDINKVTPMMRQYLEIKEQYPDTILFFRLGDFYEMFFEDAINVSHDLELTLTGKNAGLDERIPMCGVPHHAANIYIEKLIEKSYKVGIVEQVEDPATAKGIVKREVIQVISKGTRIDRDSLNEKENNYIGNIVDFNHAYGISYADISTGEIYTLLVEHDTSKVVSEIVSAGIKEIIVNPKIDINIINLLKNQFGLIINISESKCSDKKYEKLYEHIGDVRYIETIKHLLGYIIETQKRDLSHFQKVIIKANEDYLKMDIHTKRNLELTETIRLKERTNSLLWLLDKTKTAMGSRLLRNYIENPLIDLEKINERYEMVSTLLKEFILKEDLRNLLYEVYDLERLSGRIAYGNANGRDLLQLKESLKVLPAINDGLKQIRFKKELSDLSKLYNLLSESINENPPLTVKEGYLIKENYNTELDELRELRKGGKDFVARFETEEKERTGIKNLKVGYNKVFGYYIEISKGNVPLVKEEYGYDRKQTLANCERYISPILKEKEALILNAEDKIIELEYNLFCEIRDIVKTYIPKIQTNAKIISEIDVLQAFATVAEENSYVRPNLTTDKVIQLIENRHPVVEHFSNNEFVPNDVLMNIDTNILLITGPNMAGKSTYMRQLAITVIMAQIGSYVPCKEATLPVFDQIFTRIGASDDLISGESTFMVEMIEANNAIKSATPNSLILFDELGRGTATFDGMSLAQAIIEYIHNNIKAKTLFSTHYHELTDLEDNLINLKNVHVSALEDGENITFLHKVKEGSVDKSYGIHVAKLAGLPESILKRANQILNVYENKEQKRDKKIQMEFPLEEKVVKKDSEIEKYLREINPLEISPLEALNILYDLKERLNDENRKH